MRRAAAWIAAGSLTAMSLAACGSAASLGPVSNPTPDQTYAAASGAGVDQEITFEVGGVTVHGSLRRPAGTATDAPAAVLLAGSGPTDRNGNNPGLPGDIGTLSSLADLLAENGVVSLRYDKVTTGATGLGPFAHRLASLGYSDFVAEAQGALSFLAARPGVDRSRLMLIGHSEGALIALSAVTHPVVGQPTVAGLALLEGPGSRYLDIISNQLTAALPALIAAKKLTAADAAAARAALPHVVSMLREFGTLPTGLPIFLQQQGLNVNNARFLYQADQADPVTLARRLPTRQPVLTSCSTKDLQVSCAEVAKLDSGVAAANLTSVTLTKANHFLKDVSAIPVSSISELKFSSELPAPLEKWLTSIG